MKKICILSPTNTMQNIRTYRYIQEVLHSFKPRNLSLSNQINAKHFFGFRLQVFRQVGLSQRVYCMAPLANKHKRGGDQLKAL